MTLRDLYNLTAAARGHWVVCGTSLGIADILEEWFARAARPTGSTSCRRTSPAPLPISSISWCRSCERRGLFRRDYQGTTLRDHFGLARIAAPAARQQAVGGA